MKKILILSSLLFIALSAFSQTTMSVKRIDSTSFVSPSAVRSIIVINQSGASRQLDAETLRRMDAPKMISVVGTLSNSGNNSYKGYFAKESNGTRITSYIDTLGNRWAIGESVDLSSYLTASTAASTYETTSNVDTAKANIRSEMSSNINYVQTYSEATYQKITGFKTSNNVAYVAKKYSVAGDADWVLQKNTAEIGNPIAPFPNPQLAMQAITAKLVNKEIEKAVIVVLEGNVYRTAENTDTAGLTGLDYVYRANGSFYHPFPSATSRTDDDSLCFSLMFPNLDVQFGKGSGITLVLGRGNLISAYDTVAPQRISGFGTFNITYNNDRTNSGTGLGTNLTLGGGYSKGYVEFSGDSLIVKRSAPSYSGWVSLNTGSSARFLHKFEYVSTFENNSLYRGYNADYIFGKFVTDTTTAPYMYLNAPYSPIGVFYPNGGTINVQVNDIYLASNPLFYGNQGSSVYKINRLTQKYRLQYQSDYVGTNTSTTPQTVLQLGKYSCVLGWWWLNSTNQSPYVEINSARVQAPILVMEDGGSLTNTNARFVLHSVFQDSIQNGALTPKACIFVKHTGSSTNSSVNIYANIISSATSAVVVEGNSKVKFEGTYKTNSVVKPAITVTGNNTNSLFSGNAIVTGTQSSVDGTASSTITCLPSSTANTAASSNVTVTGTLNVNSAFKQ